MSNQITTAFVQQYKATLYNLVQQKGSRLRNACMIEMVTGEYAYFDQLGATAAQERVARHADSPLMNTPHSRRRVSMRDFEWGDLVDNQDKIRTLIDPTSAYLLNAMWALGRQLDDIIIAAQLGTAFAGKAGGTQITFPAGQQIAHASVGMTIDKLLQAKQKLDAAETDPDEPRYLACTSNQIKDLLNTTQVSSADYNTVKALARGEVDSFLGFNFIRTERMTKASTTRSCVAWSKSGIGLAIAADMKGNIAPRPDKAFATYVYACLTAGATRTEEEKVVEIQCTES